MGRRYDSILDTVGNTPVVRIEKLGPAGIDLFVKLESFNPMSSVKDRLALGVIENAERRGWLKPGQTVVEATSGNTGIGLAMVCARKGYPLVVVMAENFSIERRKLLRFLGAKVVLTPAAEKGSGMLAKAEELAERHGWYLCRQFDNEANAEMHARTTAREILDDFAGHRLDYWVTGVGTGGTLNGVARVLRQQRPETRIVVCEPDNCQVLGSGIGQNRKADGSPAASHPNFRPHLMQGWSPDFISSLTEQTMNARQIDRIIPIDGKQALAQARALARREGIFTGISGGATFAGALQVSRAATPGSSVLCMLPDTGERYLSTVMFEDIAVDMTDEEIEISKSTPRFRFDRTTPTAPPPAANGAGDQTGSADSLDEPEATDYFVQAIGDPAKPVVMFALEWCEFCWSVRKFFARLGVDYRSVDLDSVALQKANLGGRIRSVLAQQTACRTIPQIFVGRHFVGGCSELFDAYGSGQLQKWLREADVDFDDEVTLDTGDFLPGWVQPRPAEPEAPAVEKKAG